jgi:hypothetical protein
MEVSQLDLGWMIRHFGGIGKGNGEAVLVAVRSHAEGSLS